MISNRHLAEWRFLLFTIIVTVKEPICKVIRMVSPPSPGGVADRLPSVQRPSKRLYHTAQKSQALPAGRACFIFRAGYAGSGRCCCAR